MDLEQKRQALNDARVVIYQSDSGQGGWVPLAQGDVPDALVDSVMLARLLNGETVQSGGKWYCGRSVDSQS